MSATLTLTLFGCSTPTGVCLPSSDAMQKADPLPVLTPDKPNGKLSEKALETDDNNVATAYDGLAARHNTLVDHVQKYCQGALK